jgi:hypothetical protein
MSILADWHNQAAKSPQITATTMQIAFSHSLDPKRPFTMAATRCPRRSGDKMTATKRCEHRAIYNDSHCTISRLQARPSSCTAPREEHALGFTSSDVQCDLELYRMTE